MRKRFKEKTLYLSEKENKILLERAKKENLSVSEFLRKLIRDFQPTSPDINIIAKHTPALKQIGNDLNRITRRAYMIGYVDERSLKIQLEHLDFIVDDIKFNLENQ